MCEINPVHQLFFNLECFTSDRKMSKQDFDEAIHEIVIGVEMKLNEQFGQFRFHIHETTDPR